MTFLVLAPIGIGLLFFAVGAFMIHNPSNPSGSEKKRLRVAERKVLVYENFLIQLGVGDVGNPELEARLLLDEQRRKELH